MGNEWARHVALLKEIDNKLGRSLNKNERIRFRRLIHEMETLQAAGRLSETGPGAERAKKLLGTIAKILLALGLKKLLDRLVDQT